jgi:dTDP-4-amino-4,6-dideoxygalactose transaminase
VLKSRRLSIWPTLSPRAYRADPLRSLPFPLEDRRHRVFSRARHGLWHGVKALGMGAGDTVLVPAYHHGSEVEALERAGIVCRFYDVDDRLRPDETELESLLDASVRALYLIHYFGFPQDAGGWRDWCDHHGLILIEDAAMALLSEHEGQPTGSFGDLAIYCLYKTFALPDGGAMFCSRSTAYPRGGRRLGLVQATMRTGSWFAQRSRAVATMHAAIGGDREPDWGRDFDLGDPATRPSRITTALIPRIVDPNAAERRRTNYAVLMREIGDRADVIFREPPAGASPIAFLFRLDPERQRALQSKLAADGVRLARFWLVPHRSVPPDDCANARALRSSVVGLPVHQELTESDLHQIVYAFRTATRRSA